MHLSTPFPSVFTVEVKPTLIPESLLLSEVVFITVMYHMNGAKAVYRLEQVKLLHWLETADIIMNTFMYLETACSSKSLLILF